MNIYRDDIEAYQLILNDINTQEQYCDSILNRRLELIKEHEGTEEIDFNDAFGSFEEILKAYLDLEDRITDVFILDCNFDDMREVYFDNKKNLAYKNNNPLLFEGIEILLTQFEDHKVDKNNDDLYDLYIVIEKAIEELDEHTHYGYPVGVPINNATFTVDGEPSLDGWTVNASKKSDWTSMEAINVYAVGPMGKKGYQNCFHAASDNFDNVTISQKITGLESGRYSLSCESYDPNGNLDVVMFVETDHGYDEYPISTDGYMDSHIWPNHMSDGIIIFDGQFNCGIKAKIKKNSSTQSAEVYVANFQLIRWSDVCEVEYKEIYGTDMPSSIENMDNSGAIESITTLSGTKVKAPGKGIHIIRYSDGRTAKVLKR